MDQQPGAVASLITRSAQIKTLLYENRTGVNPSTLLRLEDTLNAVWTKNNIYLVLTGTHLAERLARQEHQCSPIMLQELQGILTEFTRKYCRYFSHLPTVNEHYGVIYDARSQINVAFVLRPGIGISGYDQDLMLQTILRKNNFLTKNQVYCV